MASQMNPKKAAGDPVETTTDLLKIVEGLAAELHPRQAPVQLVTLDTLLDRDLGLDSLARVELLARIERRFGVTLSERAFADAETPRDLLRAVLTAGAARAPETAPEIMPIKAGRAQAAPHRAQTLVEVLNLHAQAIPDRPHIRFYRDEGEGEIITYRRLKEGAEAVAAGLQYHGLQLGEPVAVMLPTGRDYFFTFFGILLAGGVPVPIYPPVRKTQIEDHLRRHRAILNNCAAATLITMPEAKVFAKLLKSRVETLQRLVTVEELSSRPETYREPVLGSQDIAFLQYTSGSTGDPKGVVLTHANLLANIRTMGEFMQAENSDVFVSWLPLYHDMGLIGAWLGCLYYAAQLVVMSPLSFITRPRRWLWAIHRYRGTLSAAPNFAYEICLQRLKDEELKGLDLSSWRIACNGAEPVSPSTVERFCKRFGKYGFRREALMPVYGLAECSVGLAFPPLGRGPIIDRIQRDPFMRDGRAVPAGDTDTRALRFVACGRPLPGHEISIADPTGRELPERREGRLQFRGPSVCSGYFHNPEQTRRLFQGDWLDSGDLAYIAEGDVYITGRTKDIIIRAGRNIYPMELEEAVGDIPDIRKGNVAVFGSTDPDSGTERLVVLAETRKTDPETRDKLRLEINALATDLVGTPPDDVVLVPPQTVLKTSSGKIRRAASRELYESGRIGKPQAAAWWQIMRLVLAGLLPGLRRARRVAASGMYAAYAWTLFGLLAPFVWVAVVLLPRSSWRWAFMRKMGRFLAWASRTPLSVQGLENLPRKRPCILVANHASYLDSYVMVASLPRELSFVAKGELAERFYIRLFLRRIRTEFVERFDKQKGIKDARRIGNTVRAGQPTLFFAEGTFDRMPGLLPFHMGAFVTAAETGVPVLPVAIRGTRSILRSGSWLPRAGAISVTIGKPIEPDEIKAQTGADLWTTALKLRDATREHILRYCGEPDLSHEKSPI